MPDVDPRTKPASKRSKKDTSQRKKLFAKSGAGGRLYEEKEKRPKKEAASK